MDVEGKCVIVSGVLFSMLGGAMDDGIDDAELFVKFDDKFDGKIFCIKLVAGTLLLDFGE